MQIDNAAELSALMQSCCDLELHCCRVSMLQSCGWIAAAQFLCRVADQVKGNRLLSHRVTELVQRCFDVELHHCKSSHEAEL